MKTFDLKRPDKNAPVPFIQKIKNTALLAYLMFTIMGIYSAAVFYEGTQFANASAAGNNAHAAGVHVQAPKK